MNFKGTKVQIYQTFSLTSLWLSVSGGKKMSTRQE